MQFSQHFTYRKILSAALSPIIMSVIALPIMITISSAIIDLLILLCRALEKMRIAYE